MFNFVSLRREHNTPLSLRGVNWDAFILMQLVQKWLGRVNVLSSLKVVVSQCRLLLSCVPFLHQSTVTSQTLNAC